MACVTHGNLNKSLLVSSLYLGAIKKLELPSDCMRIHRLAYPSQSEQGSFFLHGELEHGAERVIATILDLPRVVILFRFPGRPKIGFTVTLLGAVAFGINYFCFEICREMSLLRGSSVDVLLGKTGIYVLQRRLWKLGALLL